MLQLLPSRSTIFATISLLLSPSTFLLLFTIPSMKDLSFFLVKNTLGSKMKKGFKNICSGDDSTSTLTQRRNNHDMSCMATPSHARSPYMEGNHNAPTLEEMILQLELEEEAARKAKMNEYEEIKRRMSSVNNSDVMKSARNALNQYPRFSLDGKDAMYRSSFKNFAPVIGGIQGGRKSVCCGPGITGRLLGGGFNLDIERSLQLPQTVGGKNVVWCKPGVVPKLMGLEAMPVSIPKKHSIKGKSGSNIKKQNLRRAEKYEKEKRKFNVGMSSCKEISEIRSSCSATNDYSVLKPVAAASHSTDGRRFTSTQHLYD